MKILPWPGFSASVFSVGALMRGLVLVLVLVLGMANASQAQTAEDPDWKESATPPPPAFDVGRLIPFAGAISSALVYGIDPTTVQISSTDGVVRYVLVATGASGARNVIYEGIRCATGEFKTYARYSSDGRWSMLANAEWRSMFDNMPSKHTLYFARAGACDGGAVPQSVATLVRQLKSPNLRFGDN